MYLPGHQHAHTHTHEHEHAPKSIHIVDTETHKEKHLLITGKKHTWVEFKEKKGDVASGAEEYFQEGVMPKLMRSDD